MPNAKLYIDDRAIARIADGLEPALVELRQSLCRIFGVAEQACHLVIIPVRAPVDQTPCNLELTVLHKPERTPDAIGAACAEIQKLVETLFGQSAAIRCTLMQSDSYVVRR